MALSLAELSLLSIEQGIKNGRIKRIDHIVWPNFRQSILDFMLMRGCGVDDPDCRKIIASPEFLNGMSSIDTQSAYKDRNNQNREYETDDHEFLDLLIDSLTTLTPNGATLGSNIKELQLNIYARTLAGRTMETNFLSVARLIAQCPNLKSLDLRLVEDVITLESDPERINGFGAYEFPMGFLLNRIEDWGPSREIIENLVSLSVINVAGCRLSLMLSDQYPVLRCKKLVTFRTSWCRVDANAWASFLASAEKLELLITDILTIVPFSSPLPVVVPTLKRIIQRDCAVHADRLLIHNLLQSPPFETANLSIGVSDIPDNLAELIRTKKVDVELWINSQITPTWSPIDFLGASVKRISQVHRTWYEQDEFHEVVRNLVSKCPNLTMIDFDFSCPLNNDDDDPITVDEYWELVRICNLEWNPIFYDVNRASKLQYLHLAGDFDENALAALFKNCTNLKTLKLFDCPQVSDSNLIDFARRGGRLEKLHFVNCIKITDDGFIAIANSSGRCLTSFQVYYEFDEERGITVRTWEILIDRCRYLQKANVPGNEELLELASSKLFFRSLDI